METQQPAEEQILLTIADQSKLDLVMELLSHFDLVQARRIKALPAIATAISQELEIVKTEGSEADFWALAGIWKDRDIDARSVRQSTWRRANGSQL